MIPSSGMGPTAEPYSDPDCDPPVPSIIVVPVSIYNLCSMPVCLSACLALTNARSEVFGINFDPVGSLLFFLFFSSRVSKI